MDRPDETHSRDLTRLLRRWRKGDSGAFDELYPVVYQELRSLAGSYLASERGDHTLQPTALVHEAYLRLAKLDRLDTRDRTHFFAIAARVMRRILVDHARRLRADKRPGSNKVELLDHHLVPVKTSEELLRLNDALKQLEKTHPRASEVVEQRFFGGMSESEVAEVLGLSRATVTREWRFARLWLFDHLTPQEPSQTA